LKELDIEGAYWEEFDKRFGWRLVGWTHKYVASFVTGTQSDDWLEIRGSQA
jgi:hypothetical protein